MSRSTAVDLATAVTCKALTIEDLSIAYREAGVEYSGEIVCIFRIGELYMATVDVGVIRCVAIFTTGR